jgi:hypothetical protein
VDEIKTFFRRVEATCVTTLEHVRDRNFRNEQVEIDGRRFTSCTFAGCDLVYSGGDVEFGPGCSVENCRPQFVGPARRTVLLLSTLGLLSFDVSNGEAEGRTAKSAAAANR